MYVFAVPLMPRNLLKDAIFLIFLFTLKFNFSTFMEIPLACLQCKRYIIDFIFIFEGKNISNIIEIEKCHVQIHKMSQCLSVSHQIQRFNSSFFFPPCIMVYFDFF